MTEADYERVLDAVAKAIDLPPEPMLFRAAELFRKPPQAANDNGDVWPLIPFPDNWYASC